MTEYFRKDRAKDPDLVAERPDLESEVDRIGDPPVEQSRIEEPRIEEAKEELHIDQSKFADPNSEKFTQQPVRNNSEFPTPVTPPAAESRSGDPRSMAPRPVEPRSAGVASGPATGTAVVRAPDEEKAALFAANEANELRARWDSIQVGFVDEPRKAVQEADALVSATIKRLSEVFAGERQKLEQQWGHSENVSTEDFRVALRRYRSFFARLLAI
jgi:hypothetical protein